MTSMNEALKKAIKIPSRMERIFNHIKDHPSSSATSVGGALAMTSSSSSSLMSQMEQRGMLKSKPVSMRAKSGRGFSEKNILHYSVAIASYELLPVPKEGKKPAKKFAETAVEVIPPTVIAPRLSDSTKVEDMVDRMSIRDGRKLYEHLHKLFGPK